MFSAVKVFTATVHKKRLFLGEEITAWIRQDDPEIVEAVVTQSSDDAFHCLTLTVFYNE